jgi:hypothetical protein
MTGKRPYADFRSSLHVFVAKMTHGELPKRPTEPEVVANGLDDTLWDLLMDCWKADPQERPTIDQLIARLESM